jgi:hypothetical protein
LKYFHEFSGFQETPGISPSGRNLAVIYGARDRTMYQPIINALIATFLALGTAVSEETMQRAGKLLRELLADGVVDPETADILDRLIVAVDAEAEEPGLAFDDSMFDTLAGATRH